MRSQLAIERASLVTLHLQLARRSSIPTVTGWLRAAAIAQAFGIEMSSHLFPEYSAHLLAVTPTCHYLEYMDWATPIIAEPIEIREGRAVIPDRPGAGIDWDRNAVERYTLK